MENISFKWESSYFVFQGRNYVDLSSYHYFNTRFPFLLKTWIILNNLGRKIFLNNNIRDKIYLHFITKKLNMLQAKKNQYINTNALGTVHNPLLNYPHNLEVCKIMSCMWNKVLFLPLILHQFLWLQSQ